jgi:hypothetical protein
MFICAAAVFLREFKAWRRLGDLQPFLMRHSWRRLLLVCVALALTVAAIHVVGTYVAIPAFLHFYMRFLGRHSWTTSLIIALATPVVIFFFFEVTLKILLPKGVTEPLFFPLYATFF